MHDAILFLSGSNAVDNFEALEATAEAVEFPDSDIEITDVTAEVDMTEPMKAPDGTEIEPEGHVIIAFELDLPDSIDYAKAGNASGLEMDINNFLRREASDEVNDAVEFTATVDRTKRCDHPEDQRHYAEATDDYCAKCGGPAIEVEG
jgi:hypothetical protein